MIGVSATESKLSRFRRPRGEWPRPRGAMPRQSWRAAAALVAGLLVLAGRPAEALAARATHRAVVERVEWEMSDAGASVILVVKGAVDYGSHFASADSSSGLPPRAYVDLRPAQLGEQISREPLIVDDRLVRLIELTQIGRDTVRVVVELSRPARIQVETRDRPSRLVLHLVHPSATPRPPKRGAHAPTRRSAIPRDERLTRLPGIGRAADGFSDPERRMPSDRAAEEDASHSLDASCPERSVSLSSMSAEAS
jgi:AMIN domain